ncbi:MAG: hypothetical protein V2J07_02305 [Anaerolineae bacterium]|jgi:hypothetical protein|nr:hypothetical protein [Anaerolineae bacterium]
MMNDEMKEYDLPEFHGNEDSGIEAAPSVESVQETPVEEAEIFGEITEGSVYEEPEAIVEQKTPGKFQQLMHKVAVWALGILSLGLIVYLAFYFLMYRPLNMAHETLMDTNETLEEQLSDYRNELDTLNSDYAAVSIERDVLLSDNALYQGYVYFLSLKADMLLLQKAYLDEDTIAAALALNKINRDLDLFSATLQGPDETLGEVIYAKVSLLTTVDADIAVNIEEVETIYDYLLEMEDDLYGGLD